MPHLDAAREHLAAAIANYDPPRPSRPLKKVFRPLGDGICGRSERG